MNPRVLFVVLPERGHFHPMLGPAAELEAMGFEVAFYAPRDIRALLAEAGFHRFFVPSGRPSLADENRGASFSELLRDPAELSRWIGKMLLETVEPELAPLTQVVRDFRPSVLAMDAMAYAGGVVAGEARIPWVCLSTSLNPVVPESFDSALLRTTRALDPQRAELFARHGQPGLRFRVSDVLSPHGTIAFTTEALVGEAPGGVQLAGPSLPVHPRAQLHTDLSFAEGKPLLYMSLGTQAYHQPRWFERVFEAVRGTDMALLAAVGDATQAQLLSAAQPANVRCVPFANQLQVLQSASAFLSHGGANSVMEGLAAGVPLLLSPICNDQFHNVLFVERAGAGCRVNLEGITTEELRRVLVEAVSVKSRMRTHARRIRASYAKNNGARAAARWIAEVAR